MDRSFSLAALALTAGCGALPAFDSHLLDMTTSDPLSALAAETGHTWTARYRDDLQTPALVEGRTAPLAATGDDALRAARQFLRRHRALFSMGDGDDLDPLDGDTDELGMSHAHFQELVQGHPVWGGELLAHFASDGALVRLNGRYIPIRDTLPMPSLSADAARVTAVSAARASNPTLDANAFTTSPPRLYVYPEAHVTLAWRVQVDVASQVPQMLEMFVDAVDGSIVATQELIASLDGSGIGISGDKRTLGITQHGASYWLEDPARGSPAQRTASADGDSALPGSTVKSKDPGRWDEDAPGAGAAVDAHAFVAATWDHFASVHGRAGWDDSGKGVRATVHFGKMLNRAFFDGKQLVFGDGDGVTFLPLSGGLDVVAHEFAHAMIAHTAKLGGDGQPGTLREALADIFACFVDGNWQIGETVARKGPLRDIANPQATSDATTMSDFDSGGDVHRNSTIVSHAAWLMTQSLDAATVEKIWYRALTRYLFSSADLGDAADATLAAARDLTPDGEATIRAAWIAAGVVSK
jgi:Zn-dependent metalloprotease